MIPQNTFSGNKGYGVVITGWAHDNHVFRSFIGTQILGVNALGNKQGGVLIAGVANRNLIGLTTLLPADLISGNTGIGVTLTPGTYRNSVINNYIGLNRLDRYLRNSGRAVVNIGLRNTIRGTGPAPPHTEPAARGSSISGRANCGSFTNDFDVPNGPAVPSSVVSLGLVRGDQVGERPADGGERPVGGDDERDVKVAVGRNGRPIRPASAIIDCGRMASPSPARTSAAWIDPSGTSMPIDRSTPALANSWSATVRVPHPGVKSTNGSSASSLTPTTARRASG